MRLKSEIESTTTDQRMITMKLTMNRSQWNLLGLAVGVLTLCFALGITESRGDDDKELTIKSIMKVGFKGPLLRKVGTGKADDAEKKQFQKLVTELAKLKPPKGDAKSWEEKTKAMIAATKATIDGEDGASKLLKKSTNCAACHKAHKP